MENKIKELRYKKGWSQKRLAELVELPTSTLAEIEHGVHVPNVYTAIEISHVLGQSVEEVFPMGKKKNPQSRNV